MRYELMLAIRYLRSKRDERFVSLISWSSGIGVAIGVAALIIVLSVMYGFDVELKDKILGFSSHVDIQGPGNTLEQWPDWLQKVERLPEVARASPYISVPVMVVHGSLATGVMLKGVDISREQEIARHMVSGNFNDLGKGNPFKVVVGKDLAHKLGLRTGDSMNVVSPAAGVAPSGMTPRMRSFKVAGIFNSGFYEYDIGLVIAPMEAVQRLNRLGNRVTGIELHLLDRNQARAVADEVRQLLPPDAWVKDWMQQHRSFFRALKMERVVMGIILSLIVLVAVFNMVASLVMVVMERRKEIAILKTIGATDASVMKVFLYMGSILTGMGTLLGALFGLLLAWKLDALLAWFQNVTGVTILASDVYYIDHVPSIIDPVGVGLVVVVSLGMGLAATLYPAWRAAHVPPADALRYE
ncbi:MAG: lipoprotein-releasing ABC transporter permease subunit [Zetaproteobacteria bacterium]|nr:MAG: lipoprotein-releasing ABC transporter permease subunit [Zetaproteobacteria bacterium]